MQILVVGNGNYKGHGARYYDFTRKLINGFTRNGHNVYFMSDRDTSREGTIFRSRKLGAGYTNRVFLETCRNVRPDLIVLVHAFILHNESLLEAREMLPRAKIIQLNVDALFVHYNVTRIAGPAQVCDATFVTTGGSILKSFASPQGVACFIPNPVDPSMDWPRCHEHSDQPHDVFWAMGKSGTDDPEDPRFALPLFLERSNRVSIDYYGLNGRALIEGALFYQKISEAKMGLNLNKTRHEMRPIARTDSIYLYSSDRIAQYMGSGLLTFCQRGFALEELFVEDKEAVYFASKEELLDKVVYFKSHDDERRAIAGAGWEKSHRQLNERIVAQYVIEVAFRQPLSHSYAWPTQTY